MQPGDKMNFKRKRIYFSFTTLLLAGIVSCDDINESCDCTTEMRYNYCITINGSTKIPEDLLIIRKHALRDSNETRQDTLQNHQSQDVESRCFFEITGTSSLEIYRDNELIAEKSDIHVNTVDCCHGEDITIDFTIP